MCNKLISKSLFWKLTTGCCVTVNTTNEVIFDKLTNHKPKINNHYPKAKLTIEINPKRFLGTGTLNRNGKILTEKFRKSVISPVN